MPDDLQLYANKVRIQREGSTGDGGDDSQVLDTRLIWASIIRDIAGQQERLDPFRTREYLDIVHQAWGVSMRGNLRSGGFVRWLLEHLCTDNGTERGLTVLELREDADVVPPTHAIQFDGIEGVATFLGCALQRLVFNFEGRRKITWEANFVCLQRTTTESVWTTTDTEAGDILTTRGAGRVYANSNLGSNPTPYAITGYEGAIEIARPELEATQFSADGLPTRHRNAGNWDIAGKLLLPEISGLTNTALGSQWAGELNLKAGTETGTSLEIHAGITAVIDRRTGLANDWKEAEMSFVSRRGTARPIARFLTDQPTF